MLPSSHSSSMDHTEENQLVETTSTALKRSYDVFREPITTSPSELGTLSCPSPAGLLSTDTSIVIVGFPGTGKSTLAIIAALATGKRIIDSEEYFERAVGCSAGRLKETHGLQHCKAKRQDILRSMLLEHTKNCILVWNFEGIDGNEKLLRDFAAHHPVINVTRNVQGIQSHLRTIKPQKMAKLLGLSSSTYRSCSNLEFYNLSEQQPVETSMDLTTENTVEGTGVSRMMLKQVEQDFLAFLNNIMVQHATRKPSAKSPLIASLPLERRMYTYALVVPLSVLLEKGVDFDEAESAMDAIEFLIDVNTGIKGLLDNIGKHIAIIRRKMRVPIIFSIQNDTKAGSPGNLFTNDEYFDLLHFGLRFCPEYLTVNVADRSVKHKIQYLMSKKGRTKVIGHIYDTVRREDGWSSQAKLDQYWQARQLKCDIVRLCQPAFSRVDNISVLHFAQTVRQLYPEGPPLIAYNRKALGRMSCCFNTTMTPVTHMTISPNSQFMISSRAAQEALYSSFTLDRLSYWIFGESVDYSLSPAMHNAAYRLFGMPHEYRICQTSTIKDLDRLVSDPNLGGISITLPYKSEIISLLHSISSSAKIIGAVNTIVPLREVPGTSQSTDGPELEQRMCSGKTVALHGENTDWIGISTCIRRSLSPANAVGVHSSSVVIGAGGMARAAVYALIKLGVQNILVVNRTIRNAETLAEHYNNLEIDLDEDVPGFNAQDNTSYRYRTGQPAKFHVQTLKSLEAPWPRAVAYPTIIVSTVPVHQIHGVESPRILISSEWLRSSTGGVLIDLAYKNIDTGLLRQFRQKKYSDWVCVDGLEVLPEQGFLQFEMFTGRRAPKRLMRHEALKYYDKRDPSQLSRETGRDVSST